MAEVRQRVTPGTRAMFALIQAAVEGPAVPGRDRCTNVRPGSMDPLMKEGADDGDQL
jgi:hypothetical protein